MATTFVDYTGDGNATKAFSFPSYKVEDIKVEVNEVLKTVSTHYNITSYSTTGGGNVVFTSGNIPTSPDRVRIFRDTDVDTAKATYQAGSSVKAGDLNNNNTQLLYSAQEEQNQTLQTHKIKDQAVTTAKIKDLNVTTVKIANDAVTADKLPDDVINSEHYAAVSIDTEHIANENVTTAKLANSAVTTSKLADANVTTAKIAADNITSALIADDQINSEHYVDGSIDTQHIAADQITNALIADNQIDSEHYVDGSIDRVHLEADIIDSTKLADNAVNSEHYVDASIDHVHLANDIIDGDNIQDSVINSEHYVDGSIDREHLAADIVDGTKIADDAIGAEHIQANAVTDSEIATGTLDNRYFTETELTGGALDGRYFTETEADARYFNISTGDTIKDGDTFPDNDTTIATTAAINDRIIDLVDDVGGFVPIASETNFPTANPDVNNGAGTLVSIKSIGSTRTPSGGTVSISNGSGSNTVTITGCGSTVLTAGFGVIVETTSTLHTYAFHRLVPKATEVSTVAANATNIAAAGANTANINSVVANASNVNTVAGNISNVNTVGGISANVTTVAGISANVTTVANNNSNVTAVAGNNSNITAVADNETNINAVQANASNINTVAGNNSNVTAVAGNASNINSAVSNASNINSAVSNASNINSAVSNASNINTVAGAISNVNTTATNIANVNTTATNIADVNNFAGTYQISSSAPSTDGSGNALAEGDLYFNTTSNELQIYNGSAWQGGVTAGSGFASSGTNTFTGNQTIQNGGPTLELVDTNHNSDFSVRNANGVFGIRDSTNGVDRLNIASDGTVDIAGNLDANGGLDVTGNITVSGNVDGRDVAADGNKLDGIETSAKDDQTASEIKTLLNSDGIVNANVDASAAIAGSKISPSFTSNITISTTVPTITFTDTDNNPDFTIKNDNGGLRFRDETNSASRLFINSDGHVDIFSGLDVLSGGVDVTGEITATSHLDMPDDAKIKLGDSDDLEIYHDGSAARFHSASHPFYIRSGGQFGVFKGDGSESMIVATPDAGVQLYYNNILKSETTNSGLRVHGHLDIEDNDQIRIGTGDDLKIYHNGSQSYIQDDGTGNLNIQSNNVRINNTNGTENMALFNENGAVELFYNNSKKFETVNSGVSVTGQLYTSDYIFISNGAHLYLQDNGKARFGTASDLNIWHDGSNSRIQESGTGQLQVESNTNIVFGTEGLGETYAQFAPNAAVTLYHNNSAKLATSSSGITVTGTVAATAYTGDGSALTGVSSAEIYGLNTDANGNLIVTTTNGGADNISATAYAAFEDVVYAATGITFSVNASGNLIATI